MRRIVRDENGHVVYEHYYLASAHVYEIPRGRGLPRAKVAFEETPHGDGRLLWEEHDGAAMHEQAFASLQ